MLSLHVFFPSIAYVFAVSVNLLLRFSWMANQLEVFRGLHATQLVLLVELLEVIRRSIWNVFCVEWEIINRSMKERSMSKADDEGLLVKGGRERDYTHTYKDEIYANDRDRDNDIGNTSGTPRHTISDDDGNPKLHT